VVADPRIYVIDWNGLVPKLRLAVRQTFTTEMVKDGDSRLFTLV